ncbi:MAG: endonuclease III [Candidatus Tantalella remota]|nr:endonuclease III [Candidatus Tantalella remota]
MDKKIASKIYKILERTYPDAATALTHKNTFQLLIATMLSAQCTDARVNMVTPPLFRKYKTVREFAGARQASIEEDVRSTGFYRNKAKNIIFASKMIDEKYGGKVPDTMEELVALPGVARKTANIVLFHSFGKNEGVAVDTHVKRVSGRLGLTKNTDPVKIEPDLMELFPRKNWGHLTNLIIQHGRKVCDARKPKCGECQLFKLCPAGLKFIRG